MTEYSPGKTGEYSRIFPNFQNYPHCQKDLKDNKHNSLHLRRKYAQIFVLGHYLFLAAHSQKTVRFSEQIMSTDKYPSIFSRQTTAIVYIFPNFQNCAHCEKDLKDNKQNNLCLARKYARIFCPWTLSVPQSSQFSASYMYTLGKLFASWNR